MKRSQIESLVTEKALHLVNGSDNGFLLERLTEEGEVDLPIKNVCAKVGVDLSNKIDSIVGILGISKRLFLEAAFIDAVKKAEQIIEEEGVWEAMHDSSVALDEEQQRNTGSK